MAKYLSPYWTQRIQSVLQAMLGESVVATVHVDDELSADWAYIDHKVKDDVLHVSITVQPAMLPLVPQCFAHEILHTVLLPLTLHPLNYLRQQCVGRRFKRSDVDAMEAIIKQHEHRCIEALVHVLWLGIQRFWEVLDDAMATALDNQAQGQEGNTQGEAPCQEEAR